jgi:23S rRNA pseudouridine1911/1915/1917 synthase
MVFLKMNNLNVLYEDNHIIVVEKKPNILSQSDITGDKDLLTMVKEYVKEKYKKEGNVYIGLVHRLDRPVGGIMVFARTSKAAKRLNEQIKKHEFNKTYVAVLDGNLNKEKGKLVNYLYKDERLKKSFVTSKDNKNAKLSELEYEVIGHINCKTIVKINLITGRHHQIRVQLSSRQHSIYGDQKYGGRGHGKQICLWAYKLTIQHPISKEEMVFMAVPEKEKSWKILEDVVIE